MRCRHLRHTCEVGLLPHSPLLCVQLHHGESAEALTKSAMHLCRFSAMKMAAGYMSKTFAKAEKKDQEELAAESSPEGKNSVGSVACLMSALLRYVCQPHSWLLLVPSHCCLTRFVRGKSLYNSHRPQHQLMPYC